MLGTVNGTLTRVRPVRSVGGFTRHSLRQPFEGRPLWVKVAPVVDERSFPERTGRAKCRALPAQGTFEFLGIKRRLVLFYTFVTQ